MYDAGHFFDGYKANPDYATQCVKAALDAGARWAVLCDTNGGALPHEVERIVGELAATLGDASRLGIPPHNEPENAVANPTAAGKAGVRKGPGHLRGLGASCGTDNIRSLIPYHTENLRFTTHVKSHQT